VYEIEKSAEGWWEYVDSEGLRGKEKRTGLKLK
jgi:hypothetical protein